MPAEIRAHASPRDASRSEAPVRRGLAHAVIALLVAGQALAILFAAELFPFSHFPMFSRSLAGEQEYQQLALVGVAAGREVPLDPDWLRAATSTRIKHLRILFERAERLAAAHTPELLREVLRAYDALRASERPDLPEISALRLYRESYLLANHAQNRGRPERRERIAEVLRAPGNARGADRP